MTAAREETEKRVNELVQSNKSALEQMTEQHLLTVENKEKIRIVCILFVYMFRLTFIIQDDIEKLKELHGEEIENLVMQITSLEETVETLKVNASMAGEKLSPSSDRVKADREEENMKLIED